MNQEENFHQMLRDIIPKIQEARINVLKSEANLKKFFGYSYVKPRMTGREVTTHKNLRLRQPKITTRQA